MATITNLNGRRYFTYSNDHVPAHVHVSSNGNKAKFNLNCDSGPVKLVKNAGFGKVEINDIRKEIAGMLATCCKHWKDQYGAYL